MPRFIILLLLIVQCFTATAGENCSNSIICSNENIFSPSSNIGNLSGELQYGTVTLFWKTYDPGTNCRFIVERSENGSDFIQIATIEGNSSTDLFKYQFKDSTPLATGFYRIKNAQPDEDTAISNIIRISEIGQLPEISITPNPFDFVINVKINSKTKEQFIVKLTDESGKLLHNKEFISEKGENTVVFDEGLTFLYPAVYIIDINATSYTYKQKIYKK